MDPSTPREDSALSKITLEGQLRELFGRIAYSHKTHEKCADRLLTKHHRIKVLQIVLSGLTTTSVLGKVFGSADWTLVAAAILSTLLLVLNSYTKDYDLGEFAQKHRDSASNLWYLREKCLSLLIDFRTDLIDMGQCAVLRDELTSELLNVYKSAPPTSAKGYKAAQSALKINQELTFSDAEIDTLLPKELRRT